MKVVFFGTPEFAIDPLNKIYQSRHSIKAVVSQPDRAKNRRGELLPTPVKVAAQNLKLPVYQFESVKKEIAALRAFEADIFVTAAYGQILNQAVLDIPKHGVINLHASLLPSYRGASPIQWAVMNGDTETGVTVMQTVLELDAGDILMTEKAVIAPDDTAKTLSARLSLTGAALLVDALDRIEDGTIKRTPQNHAKATKCPLITYEMRRIDWKETAERIYNKIRAIDCFCFISALYVKVFRVEIVRHGGDLNGTPGTVLTASGGDLIIRCGSGALALKELQPQSKKRMTIREFLLGYKIEEGIII